MRSLGIILLLFLAVVIQSGVGSNLVLILLLVWAMTKEFKNIWWLVILAGLFLDLFSDLPFGVSMLSLLATFFLLTWLGQNVFGQINFGILTALIIIATLVYNLLLLALTKLFQPDFILDWINYLIYSIPIEIIYNIIIIWIIFYGLKKLSHQNYFQRNY